MKVSLGIYRNNFEFVQQCYANSNHKDLSKLVGEISAYFPLPCIVVAHFLKEGLGESDEINKVIKGHMEYYKYDEVVE